MHYNLAEPLHVWRFTVSHALSCKKVGFVAQRQNGIQNLLTSLLSKFCKDVDVEPHLLLIDSEVFNLKIHRHKP